MPWPTTAPETSPCCSAARDEGPKAEEFYRKAIAARPNGALDRDVARTVYSPNNREAAYAALRVRGLIRKLPVPLLPITYQVTEAGRAHLVAVEPQPCRALMVRPCMALIVLA